MLNTIIIITIILIIAIPVHFQLRRGKRSIRQEAERRVRERLRSQAPQDGPPSEP